jgi:MFS transporter, FSR family, fosmidomycin resistance protein
MTQISESPHYLGAPSRGREAKLIGLIGGAHFISHVNFIVLPPLFAFIRADYHVSYAELGLLLAVFNILSTVLQTPAGFLVDRMSASALLIGALALGGAGFVVSGLIPTYWALAVGWAIAGVANTIFHPADYALLSHGVEGKRMGQAFSLHTFFGLLGTAVTPAAMLFLADLWGWHSAIVAAGILGFAGAAILLVQRAALGDGAQSIAMRRADAKNDAGWKLLLSPPILRNMMFFVMLSIVSTGLASFTIVGLGALYDTPLPVANYALTAFLMTNALGVLAGGVVATHTDRHDLVAWAGLVTSGLALLAVAIVPLSTELLVTAMALGGFLNGVIMPARDMIVRAVTPAGSYGKVFGFVSVGFGIGGIIAPLLYGWLMDQGEPRLIFLSFALVTFLTVPLIGRIRATD